MRRISPLLPLPAVPAPRTARPGFVELTFAISAVTPVIGAGVEAGTTDLVTPVRGTTVRGLLRTWWRRFYNAKALETLHAEERRLWGWASAPGCVDAHVFDIVSGEAQDNWNYHGNLTKVCGVALSPDEAETAKYLLFPLQRPQQNQAAKRKNGVLESLSFQLTLRCPKEDEARVRAAVRGWIQFGGLGARTHRGCGSLYCPQINPANQQQAQGWPKANPIGEGQWALYRDPPLTQAPGLSPVRAWLKAARILRTFRQNHIGRTGRSRSHWPEPDSIRRLTGKGPAKHLENLTGADKNFPRAELGLPIVFHFKDEHENNSMLTGHTDRLASPLIFKALPFGDGAMALPTILRLHYRRTPDEINLEFDHPPHPPLADPGPWGWDYSVLDPDVANYSKSPLRGRSEKGSAVEALLAYARESGFK